MNRIHPAPDMSATKPTSPGSSSPLPVHEMETILIVDDDPIARTSLRGRLKRLGYQIQEAESGGKGLEIARRSRPALVIADWMMPELDGPSLCEAIRTDPDLRTTQLIIMTANDQPDQIKEGLARGANDYVTKAASSQELLARVQASLRTYTLLHQLEQTKDELAQSYQLLNRKQDQMEAELRSAAEFVRTLLPSQGAVRPNLHVAWNYLPSSMLGGDLFNVAPWGDGSMGLYIMDASGHGVAAALRAATLMTFLRGDSLLKQVGTYEPGPILTEINRRFPLSPEGEYFTLWVGHLNVNTRELQFSTAGHAGALLIAPNEAPSWLARREFPIGFKPEHRYDTDTMTLVPGTRLFLFSDGLYEELSPSGECWGKERVAESLWALRDLPLHQTIAETVHRGHAWLQHDQFSDDAALVGLELLPDGEEE